MKEFKGGISGKGNIRSKGSEAAVKLQEAEIRPGCFYPDTSKLEISMKGL